MIPSTNTNAPFFAPRLPEYPDVTQIVRVYGAKSQGLYACYVQQFVSATSVKMRDREAALVLEPNGNALAPGYYKARLVTENTNPFSSSSSSASAAGSLPLYVTSTLCCTQHFPSGTSLASSSGSSGSSMSKSSTSPPPFTSCCVCPLVRPTPMFCTFSGCGDCLDGSTFSLNFGGSGDGILQACMSWGIVASADACPSPNGTCIVMSCWKPDHVPVFTAAASCFNADGVCVLNPWTLVSYNCDPFQVIFQHTTGKGGCPAGCIMTFTQ